MTYPLELEANTLQLIALIVLTTWYIVRYKEEMELSRRMFIWGLISVILMNMYWVAMIFVEGAGDYASFTACETGAAAASLIWISLFQTRARAGVSRDMLRKPFMVCLLMFGAWNVLWWIIWTGRIINDFFTGVPLACLLYMIFFVLIDAKAVSFGQKISFYSLFAILFVFEIPVLLYDNDSVINIASDWICVCAWAALVVLCVVYGVKDKQHRTTWLFASMVFAQYAQYLTDGYKYSVFVIIQTIISCGLIIYFKPEEIREVAE